MLFYTGMYGDNHVCDAEEYQGLFHEVTHYLPVC